jgi:hypothetical protein
MRPETKFVKRMAALFGDPNSGDINDVIVEYENALKGEPDLVLQRAADLIARQRTIRAWPTVAECLKAVKSVKGLVGIKGDVPPLTDFDGWWSDRMSAIGAATSADEIEAQIALIEPYVAAKMISPKRLPQARAHAQSRLDQLKKGGA